MDHLRTCIGDDYACVYEAARTDQKNGINGFVLRLGNSERETFDSIDIIVIRSLPLSNVECQYTRRIAKLKPVSAKPIRQHILSLTELMKNKIKADLPSKFVIAFDRWSERTEHYIGVSAAYARMDKITGKEVSVQVMLSMRPPLADGIKGMTAADLSQHMTTTLNSYGKGCGNVLCIVGDNCNVNRSMARTLQVPLIGCASHKLNLAVKLWIQNEPQLTAIILKVSNIMKKASNLKVAAQLRLLTTYTAVRENATRWSSTNQMITRFLQIQVQLSSIVNLLALFPDTFGIGNSEEGSRLTREIQWCDNHASEGWNVLP